MSRNIFARPVFGLPLLHLLLTGLLMSAVIIAVTTEWFYRSVAYSTNSMYTRPFQLETMAHPDLMGSLPRFPFLHSLAFFYSPDGYSFMYPAGAVPVYAIFYSAAPYIYEAYLAVSLAGLAVTAILLSRGLMRRNVPAWMAVAFITVSMACSYPVWFLLSQGNIEIVIWFLIVGGTALYWRNRGYAAAFCFGIAAAIKLYPGLFLLLPLYRKQWRQAAFGFGCAAAYSICALVYVGPTLAEASKGIANGIGLFRSHFILRVLDGTGFDHSVFGLIKFIFRNHLSTERLDKILAFYFAGLSILLLALLVTRLRNLPLANQLAFCNVVCILFPPTSFEYTLLHLWTVYGLLLIVSLSAVHKGAWLKGIALATTCCTVCLMFLPELIHHGFRFTGVFKSTVLIVLFFALLRYPFPAEDEALTTKLAVA